MSVSIQFGLGTMAGAKLATAYLEQATVARVNVDNDRIDTKFGAC
jgi:urocanate hydratase